MILHLKRLVVLFLLAFFLPSYALSANYGEGSYGSGTYNIGPVSSGSPSSTSTNSSSSSGESCNDQMPGTKVPWLYGAIAKNHNSIELYFTPADEPVSKYILEYGFRPGDYLFGVQDLGLNSREQMSYVVGGLAQSTKYYFKIRAQNGCQTGEWSNEISSTTLGAYSFNSLVFTESELIAEENLVALVDNSCQAYTVKFGDTLWSVAKTLLGDGNKYQELIDINSEQYPSLKTSKNINVGWVLRPPCDSDKKSNTQKEGGDDNLYTLKVKVQNQDKGAVQGAEVTIHSSPQSRITNKDGLAIFEKVEAGEHRVVVAYENYQGEQSINLSGDAKIIALNITIEQKDVIFSPTSIIVISLLFIALVIVLSLLRKKT